ncbi:MAG: hypothetical protein PHE25_06080 [Candidatus Gracilibacteria bacterium]|nr:hypothetical protein [Candidatus Gracilibacteria bacterium]
MKNNLFQVFIKIFMLTGVFFVIINYFGYFLNADNEGYKPVNSNIEKFTSQNIDIVGSVGVAISTNIGTRYKQINETPVAIYKDVVDIGYILGNTQIAKDKIISINMIMLNEYFNILKTDIRSFLGSSNDREFALNSFIAQLEYRYKVGIQNSQTLTQQRAELLNSYNSSNNDIQNLKNKISSDFGSFNNDQTIKNIDGYLKIRQENLNARTYIVFINKFLNYYAILNDYNKKVLDTLINNKEIIIKNSQVVIPDTGGELLKQLKLIYTEEEWKAGNQ